MKVLVINGGSSSWKCRFDEFRDDSVPVEAPQPAWEARVEWNPQTRQAALRIITRAGETRKQVQVESLEAALEPVLESLWSGASKVVDGPAAVNAVGHRIVHGGLKYRQPMLLTSEVCAALAKEADVAPEHNRVELEAVRAAKRLLGPRTPQIAVFDTGFHATLEPPAYVYPGPYEWLEQGIRRFGFHGINHQYVSERAAHLLSREPASLQLITCHLGNGCSLAAVRAGRSIDTTMGFTPLDGLMMGTRSGALDPGILIYLLRRHHYSADDLDRILNRESGLKGISGRSGDVREILAAMQSNDERAKLAFDLYAHRLCRELGGMLAVLGGVDALVFTGGVGENCASLRERVCAQLGFLGLKLDSERNARPQPDQDIAAAASSVRVLVIAAQEEWQIARQCCRFVRRGTEG
ncbi:MAG TPA: acetate kinase [Bryobacteraceae bacterium]|nr:acetate kinase [Bryobacteraceae bacterium]